MNIKLIKFLFLVLVVLLSTNISSMNQKNLQGNPTINLEKLASNIKTESIKGNDEYIQEIFLCAAKDGRLDIVQIVLRLIKKNLPQKQLVEFIINEKIQETIYWSIKNGYLEIARFILNFAKNNLSKQELGKFLVTTEHFLYRDTKNGHFEIAQAFLKFLQEIFPEGQLANFLMGDEDIGNEHIPEIFLCAAKDGHLDIVQIVLRLIKKNLPQKQLVEFIINEEVPEAFYWSIQNEYLEISRFILNFAKNNLSKQELKTFIMHESVLGAIKIPAIVAYLLNLGVKIPENFTNSWLSNDTKVYLKIMRKFNKTKDLSSLAYSQTFTTTNDAVKSKVAETIRLVNVPQSITSISGSCVTY